MCIRDRDKYPHELSGGMRQRVSLLRTYLFGHKLFLLDEAFSALDEMTKMELHAWYLEIHKQLQLTTLIITHSIEEALNLSDRIYILKNRPEMCIRDRIEVYPSLFIVEFGDVEGDKQANVYVDVYKRQLYIQR